MSEHVQLSPKPTCRIQHSLVLHVSYYESFIGEAIHLISCFRKTLVEYMVHVSGQARLKAGKEKRFLQFMLHLWNIFWSTCDKPGTILGAKEIYVNKIIKCCWWGSGGCQWPREGLSEEEAYIQRPEWQVQALIGKSEGQNISVRENDKCNPTFYPTFYASVIRK